MRYFLFNHSKCTICPSVLQTVFIFQVFHLPPEEWEWFLIGILAMTAEVSLPDLSHNKKYVLIQIMPQSVVY